MKNNYLISIAIACAVAAAIIFGLIYNFMLQSSARDQLVQASKDCDLITIDRLLKSGVSPNKPSAKWIGFSVGEPQREIKYAINAAASSGCLQAMSSLAANGADLMATDSNGMPPLSTAARWGESEVVEWLLENGADPTFRDSNRRTALHWAAGYGDLATVKILKDQGLSADAQDIYGTTPLNLASKRTNNQGAVIVRELSRSPD